MSRRVGSIPRAIGCLFLLVLGLLGTSCTGTSSPSLSAVPPYGDLERLDPQGVIVTIWYPESHEAVLLTMLDRFNQTNPWRIAVRGERGEDSAHLYQRLRISAPTGKLPDLVIASPGYLAAIAADGLAVEYSPYVQSTRWGFPAEAREGFFPFVWEMGTLSQPKGQYGFPFALSAGLLFYNRGWLHRLGSDHPPHTWEEFQRIACAASDPASGIYGYEFLADDRTFVRLLVGWGGRLMNSEETEYAFGSPEGLEALTFLHALIAEGCAVREPRWEQAEADFGAGRVLMVTSQTFHISHYRQVAAGRSGLDWDVAPLPTTSGLPLSDISGLFWLIPPTTPQRQLAAWLVVRWMNDSPQQEWWAIHSGYLPHRRLSPEPLAALAEDIPQWAHALALMDLPDLQVVTEPEVIGYEACRQAMQAMVSAVVAGEDPAPWLAQTVDFCNHTLSRRQ
ncbi:MAG: extracellular solute-binding protein [Anaerolineae bacterium]|nr:extracellular solute-binding protein [Anaerolineae bacterium]MDW8067837.1 extracellular solute-binding protein [Anaerolineae bacterium]